MPGMTAASRIVVDQRNDVIRVPNQALRYVPRSLAGAAQSDQPQIWVLRDGKPVAVPVVAGLDDDSFTEIASGDVKPGDLVITAEQLATASKAVAPRLVSDFRRTPFAGQHARTHHQSRERDADLSRRRRRCACVARRQSDRRARRIHRHHGIVRIGKVHIDVAARLPGSAVQRRVLSAKASMSRG